MMRPVTDDMGSLLWNADVSATDYGLAGEKYQNAILEQYKLYVEMADRVSARRGLTNTFFLTLNTGVFALIGALAGWKERPAVSPGILLLPLVIAVGQCVAWWWLVRSYRLLNGAKFKVVGALEERLPSSVYWRAEWVALGEGKDWRKYLPLSHLEQWVPILFALVYVLGFIVAVRGS